MLNRDLSGEDPTRESAGRLARRIAAGEISAVEVVEAYIRRIEEVDGQLNAVVIPLFDQARQDALEADQAQARGETLGLLHGVPVTVKESFEVVGTDATMGLVDRVGKPSATEGPLVQRLRRAGAILLGKTNLPQLMLMHESENPVYGRTNNPWDLERGPGGSSGGEAAILAAGGSALGLASDMGGSIRQPSHACGICGIKPTSGRLTTQGYLLNYPGMQVIPLQTGPMARCVDDLTLAMRVLVAPAQEPAEWNVPHVPWPDPAKVDVAGMRIAYWSDDGVFTPSPAITRAVEEAADLLRKRGAIVEPFVPPRTNDMMRLYFSLMTADGLRGLRRLLGTGRVDQRIRRMLRRGGYPLWPRPVVSFFLKLLGQRFLSRVITQTGPRSADVFWQLTAELNQYRETFRATLEAEGFQAMIFPPHSLPALPHGNADRLLSPASDCFLANLLGIPAGVVPVTRVREGEESDRPPSRDATDRLAREAERGSAGLPIGVQVAAWHWREDIVLSVMKAVEEERKGFSLASDNP